MFLFSGNQFFFRILCNFSQLIGYIFYFWIITMNKIKMVLTFFIGICAGPCGKLPLTVADFFSLPYPRVVLVRLLFVLDVLMCSFSNLLTKTIESDLACCILVCTHVMLLRLYSYSPSLVCPYLWFSCP